MGDYQVVGAPSYHDFLKIIEADIQYANMLAASVPKAKDGACLQMKLAHTRFAPIILFMFQWMDCSCVTRVPSYLNLFHVIVYMVNPDGMLPSHGRKASLREFYAVILPSLQRHHECSLELSCNVAEAQGLDIYDRKKVEPSADREEECGICLETCTKIVLPNCCHAICVNCYRDWNVRSESCPFCRGSLKKVKSEDLWVLICNEDVVDQETVAKEDMLSFYLYISSLPKDGPDALFLVYSDYLF